MIDLLFLLLLGGLFAATAGFISVCDRLVGSDDEALGGAARDDAEQARKLAA